MYPINEMTARQIEATFTHHPPEGNQVDRYGILRELARRLAMTIATNTPPSREQSLALTHLQEAVMWANASIAIHEVWDGPKLVAPITLTLSPQ